MHPRLVTLGQLRVDGLAFGREKPLLLLAYLSVRGPQPRRSLARQFWPEAAHPLNSLSVAVAQLRRADAALIQGNETQVQTALISDAQVMRAALQAGDWPAARRLYGGPFLNDLKADDLPEELEEWVMTTRETLADAYRDGLLQAAHGAPDAGTAAELAFSAYGLPSATPLPPARLREIHDWLEVAGHPGAGRVWQEAQREARWETPGNVPGTLAGTRLRPRPDPPLLGRRRELERLAQVRAGETLWVCGAAGMGRAALLRAASAGGGTLLQGRSGRAFQTLAPLSIASPGSEAPGTPESWLALLSTLVTALLIDDWEAADPDSRRILLALAHSHAGPPLILSSRERSPLGAGGGLSELTLHPLPARALTPELYARTGGLPALVQAALHQASLQQDSLHQASSQHGSVPEALGALLSPLSPRARQLLACLAVQDTPDLRASGAALQLGPEDMAELQEALGRAGWWRRPDGEGQAQVVPRGALLEWLETQPSLHAEVLMLLAPHTDPERALPLYLRAHALTGSSDLPGFQEALRRAAQRLLDAEQASEAEVLLAQHARTPETQLLHARALDALGRSPEAMKCLENLPPTPVVQVVRARTLFRLGDTGAARLAAQDALKGDLADRAQAYSVLGALGLAAREYAPAKQAFERACGLFRLLGDEAGYLNALCNQAVAMTELTEDTGAVMAEILNLGEQKGLAQTLLNIGWLLERQSRLDVALSFYLRAGQKAESLNQAAIAASAWNNVGVIQQKLGHLVQATQAYQVSIQHARQTGEIGLLAVALGNLAELQESLPLIEEAIELLQSIGQDDLVAYFTEQREAFRGRSGVT